MPRETVPIAETYHSITRPVAISVIKDMLDNLGLNKDTSIMFPGLADQVPTNSSTTDHATPTTPVNLPTRQQAFITVNETFADHTARSENPEYLDALPIFYDAALGLEVKPVYNTVLMDIGIVLRGSDATTVRRWFIHIKDRITRDFQTGAHLIHYSYVIPEAIMMVLFDVYDKREANAGYGDSRYKYINEHFSKRFIIDTNQAGKANTPLIREEQTMVHAWFEFDQTNPIQQPQKNNNTGEWEIELQYKFYYSKVEKLLIDYPLVIHNQQIDEKFINLTQLPAFEKNFQQRTTDARLPLNNFLGHRDYGLHEHINPGLPIPWYDDWEIPRGLYSSDTEASFLRILTLVDDTEKVLLSLQELGEFKMTQTMIRYLKIRPMTLTALYQNVFCVRVYKDQELMRMDKTIVDDDLNISHTWDYDLRRVYHVSVSIITDPSMLSDDALRDLGKDPCFAADYFYMITGTYKYLEKPKSCPVNPDDLGDEDPLTVGELKQVIEKISYDRTLIAAPPLARMFTVGDYTIISRRK